MWNIKKEEGYLTMFVVVIMLGLMVLAGIFINVIMNYTNTNFAKKSMQEATRVRALTTDIYMKERYGLIETVYRVDSIADVETNKSVIEKEDLDTETNKLRNREIIDPLTNKRIPTRFSIEYQGSVNYANYSAKKAMIESVNSFVGNSSIANKENAKMIDLYEKNICFDVKPLQKTESVVHFSCNVEDNEGKRHRITANIKVSGYEDVEKNNKFVLNNTDSDDEGEIKVTNVVFGAAVITPRLFMPNAISNFTFSGEQNQFIYSIAYPQIDTCYSGEQNGC